MNLFARVWMTITLCVLSCAHNSRAADVVIVRTSDAEPYKQAEAALRQQLGASGKVFGIKSLLAREASDKGIDASIGRPDVVVDVGTAAAKWLHKQLPADVKLTYCMVSNLADATLLLAAVRTKVPVWRDSLAFVLAGALVGVGVDLPDSLSRWAAFVCQSEK
jgi:hypothetical protein